MQYSIPLLLLILLLTSCSEAKEETTTDKGKNIKQEQTEFSKTGAKAGSKTPDSTPKNTGEEFFIETKNIADFNSITTMEKI